MNRRRTAIAIILLVAAIACLYVAWRPPAAVPPTSEPERSEPMPVRPTKDVRSTNRDSETTAPLVPEAPGTHDAATVGGARTIRVRLGGTSSPLAGARWSVGPEEAPTHSGQTDAFGLARLSTDATAAWTEDALRIAPPFRSKTEIAGARVPWPADDTADVIVIDLEAKVPVVRLRGRVLLNDLEPAARTPVLALPKSGPTLVAHTDADGRFEFSVPVSSDAPDARIELLAWAATHFAGRELVPFQDAQSLELILPAADAQSPIEVEVTMGGVPVVSARVKIEQDRRSVLSVLPGKSDDVRIARERLKATRRFDKRFSKLSESWRAVDRAGRVAFARFEPGPATIKVRSDLGNAVVQVVLETGPNQVPVALDGQRVITGRLLLGHRPAESLAVVLPGLTSIRTTTDADGSFRLAQIPGDVRELELEVERRHTIRFPIPPPQPGATECAIGDIHLDRIRQIRCGIVRADGTTVRRGRLILKLENTVRRIRFHADTLEFSLGEQDTIREIQVDDPERNVLRAQVVATPDPTTTHWRLELVPERRDD